MLNQPTTIPSILSEILPLPAGKSVKERFTSSFTEAASCSGGCESPGCKAVV